MAKLTSISSTLAIYKKVPVVGKHVAPHQYDPQGSAFVIFRVAANKISLNLSFYLIGQTYQGPGSASEAGKPNQQLTIRLPPRAPDVYGSSGRIGHDILLVTAGASVQMQWNPAGPRLRQATQCLDGTCGTRSRRRQAQSLLDQAQVWRDSDDAVAVIVKYAIASIPLLPLIWYFLAVT